MVQTVAGVISVFFYQEMSELFYIHCKTFLQPKANKNRIKNVSGKRVGGGR